MGTLVILLFDCIGWCFRKALGLPTITKYKAEIEGQVIRFRSEKGLYGYHLVKRHTGRWEVYGPALDALSFEGNYGRLLRHRYNYVDHFPVVLRPEAGASE